MAARRHLPIAGQKPAPAPGTVAAPDANQQRPPWHWVGIGALLILVLWLPLAMLGMWLAARLSAAVIPAATAAETAAALARAPAATRLLAGLSSLGPLIVSLLVAFASGGALVGRHGGHAGRREAAAAGVLAATAAWALGASGPGPLSAALLLWPPLALLGGLAAFGGGAWGQRKRPAAAG